MSDWAVGIGTWLGIVAVVLIFSRVMAARIDAAGAAPAAALRVGSTDGYSFRMEPEMLAALKDVQDQINRLQQRQVSAQLAAGMDVRQIDVNLQVPTMRLGKAVEPRIWLEDINSFQRGALLTNNAMDALIFLLQSHAKRAPPAHPDGAPPLRVHVCNSTFWQRLANIYAEEVRLEDGGRSAAAAAAPADGLLAYEFGGVREDLLEHGVDIRAMDVIFIPIIEPGKVHIYLAIVWPQLQVVQVMDSMAGPSRSFITPLNTLMHWLVDEWRYRDFIDAHGGPGNAARDAHNWHRWQPAVDMEKAPAEWARRDAMLRRVQLVGNPLHMPVQRNGTDCGVWMLALIYHALVHAGGMRMVRDVFGARPIPTVDWDHTDINTLRAYFVQCILWETLLDELLTRPATAAGGAAFHEDAEVAGGTGGASSGSCSSISAVNSSGSSSGSGSSGSSSGSGSSGSSSGSSSGGGASSSTSSSTSSHPCPYPGPIPMLLPSAQLQSVNAVYGTHGAAAHAPRYTPGRMLASDGVFMVPPSSVLHDPDIEILEDALENDVVPLVHRTPTPAVVAARAQAAHYTPGSSHVHRGEFVHGRAAHAAAMHDDGTVWP